MPGAPNPQQPTLPPRRMRVNTPIGSYDVTVGSGLLQSLGVLTREVTRASRSLLVHDAGLPAPTVSAARDSLRASGMDSATLPLAADEQHKSFASVESIVRAAIDFRLERAEPIIALGGGIVGDVTGFAAASYRRGVPIIQCPTTLLAMVDASVGGKTGVNVAAGGTLKKNMAGAFYQPLLVVCDVQALSTLPDRELRSGLAECIKHGLIGADFGDAALSEFLFTSIAAFLARNDAALIELVSRNVAIKAVCIGDDVFETAASSHLHGGRMALNCGHTVAHAIETLPALTHESTKVDGLTHGEAVGLGLLAECHLAVALKLNDAGAPARLSALLAAAGLPTRIRGLPPATKIAEAMLDDKKVAAGKLRMALPCAGQHCRLVTDPPREALLAAIESIRAT